MNCIICYDDVKILEVPLRKCKCKYHIHRSCLKKFRDNSNFNCPVCRSKKVDNIYYISLISIFFLSLGLLLYTLLIIGIVYCLIKDSNIL